MLYMQKIYMWLGVITMIAAVITMVPHSAYAKKSNDNNVYSYSSSQFNSNSYDSHYNTGYTDGYSTAQTDWNTLQYSMESGGNNYCPSGHSHSYCNGYGDGYAQLWADWTYNQKHGLNFATVQDQTSSVSTNIKGNGNTVNNIITQGQAANSGNDPSGGSSNGKGDLSGCRFLCSVIK